MSDPTREGVAARIREEAMRRVDRRYDHTLDECHVPELHQAEYDYEEKRLREVEEPVAASGHRRPRP